MDEYTPTTDEVRAYASTHGRMPPEWFERWLAEHDRVVAANAWDEAGEQPMSDIFHLILAHDPTTMGHEWKADPEDRSPRGCKVCNDNVRGEFDE